MGMIKPIFVLSSKLTILIFIQASYLPKAKTYDTESWLNYTSLQVSIFYSRTKDPTLCLLNVQYHKFGS